ncbi:tetratricopeptide repeat protein [Stappia stellulata]|uniref:tetratricopeptide repeat protein n=1 Tax=Stappia stellulata TaxID=71235 RepID=UPI000401CB58|nr:tetratricopeptide repeat protein [Stappia stellulata]
MSAPSPAVLEQMRKALVLQRDGNVARARTLYEKILRKDPQNTEAVNLLGLCFLEQDFPKRALALFERAIALVPNEARYRVNRLDALERLGDQDAAIAVADSDVQDAADPALLYRRASLLRRSGRIADALRAYDAAVRADPANGEALVEFGQTLILAGKHEEATKLLDFALQAMPGHTGAILSLADALNQLDRAPDARDLLIARADAFDLEHDAIYHLSLANSHWGCGAHAAAVDAVDAALALGLDTVDSRLVRGKALYHLGRFEEAIADLEKAHSRDPERHEAAMTLGFAYLSIGDLTRGWPLAERRVEANLTGLITRQFTRPKWQGEPLEGKTLMVWDDQGIGDVLRCASMFTELAEQADRLVVECHPKIVPLLARNFPQAQVRARQHEARGTLVGEEDFDLQCAFGALPMHLRPTHAAFPKTPGYLAADPQRVAELKTRAPLDGPRPKVGLSWTSGNRSGLRRHSYLTLEDLLPLLKNDAVDFVLLDYTDRSAEIAEIQARSPITLHRWGDLDLYDDLETVAALTACMDLVISANTSVADMAGALGVPAWRFGPVTGTVLLGADTPPWAPATRYLRLDPQVPASGIVPRLVADLEAWCAARD